MRYTNISNAFEKLPQDIDYYLMCASYESRSETLLNNNITNKIRNFNIFYFKEFLELTNESIEKFEHKYNAKRLELSLSEPISVADSLLKCFDDLERGTNVVVDISTFTRESILIILKFFHINKKLFSHIFLFYRCADVNQELSSMVKEIRSVLGYMGDFQSSSPLHLVLLSGFETSRAKEMIDIIEPDYISISYGNQNNSINDKLQGINESLTENLISYYKDRDIFNSFNHSLVDMNETKSLILNLAEQYPTHNFILIPLSNKLSTIGAGLAALEDSRIQICYSEMLHYNVDNYSEELDDCFIEELKL